MPAMRKPAAAPFFGWLRQRFSTADGDRILLPEVRNKSIDEKIKLFHAAAPAPRKARR